MASGDTCSLDAPTGSVTAALTARQKGGASRPGSIYVVACTILAACKIWLVAQDEIVARYAPNDQLRFAEMADQLIKGNWLGDYTHLTLIREPAYALWISAVSFTGIPLRVASEVLLVAGAFLLSYAIRRASGSLWVSLCCFGVAVFQPQSFYWNNELRAETLYLPMLLVAIGALVLAQVTVQQVRRRSWAVVAGFCLAVLWHTRPETALIVLLVVSLAVIELVRYCSLGEPRRSAMKRAAFLSVVPALFILASTLAVSALNKWRYGGFVTTELSASGFVAAHKALLRIQPDKPRRFVTVPVDVRRRAYGASPAFRELEPFLEGELGRRWTAHGCQALGVCDDIADGWFIWAFREAAALAGHARSFSEADAYYRRIATEIEAACRSGELPSRWVFWSFLNPSVGTFLPHLPRSLRRMWRVFSARAPVPSRDETLVPPEAVAMFDRVANRRRSLIGYRAFRIGGWAFGFEDAIIRVALRDRDGHELRSSSEFSDRPDVIQFLRERGIAGVPSMTGFFLTWGEEEGSHDSGPSMLVLLRKSGTEVALPLAQGASFDRPLAFAVDYLMDVSPHLATPAVVQACIRQFFPWPVKVLTVLGAVGAIICIVRFRSLRLADPDLALIVLIFIVVTSRVALFALIDASSFPGEDPRYLYPVLPLYACLALLLVHRAVLTVRRQGLLPTWARRAKPTVAQVE
jgi:hypothetical protein